MRRFRIDVAAVATMILTIFGCGSSADGAAEKTPVAETSVTSATQVTSATSAPTGDAWTTVATLRSSDSLWKDMKGMLVSEPFTVTGEVRLLLDMPDSGTADGVLVM